MRGTQIQGRFKIPFEIMSNDEGIVDELRSPVGTTVSWWTFDPNALASNYTDWVDNIYEVSNQTPGKGVLWNTPFDLPVIMAQHVRGDSSPNERGFYTTDTLKIVVAVADLNRVLPDMITNPTNHIKDHVVFNQSVFRPMQVNPLGRYAERYSVVQIDCNQINPEELQNYGQFLDYAN
jgi:hypothetical protein